MMSQQLPPDDSVAEGLRVSNTATGDAKVDAQIGVVEGDAVFHKHETIYQVTNGDSAEQKYRVARNNLDGGIPRIAEDLIGQALDAGLATTEVAYYYAISVLSDRSLNQLGPKELDKFFRALSIAQRSDHDEWWAAIGVISDLLRCVLPADSRYTSDPDTLQAVLDSFQAISKQRQAEITRHLDMILSGAVQDQLDRLNAETVAVERTGGERTDRAWKYFHPDPTEPRHASPIPLGRGRPRVLAWAKAVLGVVSFGLGVMMSNRVAGDVTVLVLPLSTFLIGWMIAEWYGSLVLTMRIRLQMKEQDHTRFPASLDELDYSYLGLKVSRKFAAAISRKINYYFIIYGPRKRTEEWNARTKGIKAELHDRMVRLYGARRVPPTTVYWLIRWHAKQAREQWNAETLPEFRKTLRPAVSTVLLLWGGIAIAGTGATWLINISLQFGLAAIAISMAEIGAGCVGGFGVAYLFGDRRAMAQERANLDQIFEDEKNEYERWRDRLRDRPTDAEMANWLEYDKTYLKTVAMRRCNLNNREIIAHVVLTAGKPGAKRARVIYGPPRYSVYKVLVFLLTENGVREVDVDLDFRTTAIYDERRTSFSYDGLASAEVLEEGFRAAKGQRHIVFVDREVHLTDRASLVICRRFKLSLVNDQTIEVLVDNYDGLLDENTVEDKSQLDKLALDSSGVAVALQILEAVAAEGREWIARERDRRARRWEDWKRTRGDRLAIMGRAWLAGIEARRITTTIDEEPSINGAPSDN